MIREEYEDDPIGRLLGLEGPLPGLSEGVSSAYRNTPEKWRERFEEALLECLAEGEPFIVDDIRRRGVPDPEDPHSWGSMVAWARNQGWIQAVGGAESRRVGRDAVMVRLWTAGPNAPTTNSSDE